MQQFNISKGVKGWKTLENYVIRFRYMITKEAKRKAKILIFWKKYGLEATGEAYKVKRPTLFLWQKLLKQSGGKLESLNNKSTKPKSVNKRRVDYRVEKEIIRLRTEHPRYGKDKIAVDLKKFCKQNNIEYKYTSSTVGRILTNLKERDLLPTYTKVSLYGKTGNVIARKQVKKRKKLRIKDYKPKENDNLVQVDTIIYFIDGIKRYIVTAIHPETDFAFSFAYKNHSSASARDFFIKLQRVAPFVVTHVQTDNGSEFDKYFGQYMKDQNIVHFHNYPRCPKMNCYVERFNRTLKEEFANWKRYILANDLDKFNFEMTKYLLWYNTERPHWSLGLISPMEFIINSSNLSPEKSNMLWTDTST